MTWITNSRRDSSKRLKVLRGSSLYHRNRYKRHAKRTEIPTLLCSKEIWTSSVRNSKKFQGACIDTGAQQCVVGLKQAKAYCKERRCKFKLLPSRIEFRFGDGSFRSLGAIPIRIPTPNGSFIEHRFDVVDADIPLLFGLDLLDSAGLIVDNVNNCLENKILGYTMPIVRKFGHLYLEWPASNILFTRSELTKLHRQFKHPSTDKLINLLKRSKVSGVDANTKKMLEEIRQACETCTKFSRPRERFKVTIPPDKIVFNEEVALDLMWLEGNAVLHVVDCQTHFNSACKLKGHSVEDVWEAFVKCWSSIYTGYPRKLKVDQGSNFTSVRWQRLCDMVGTEIQFSGVESHHSLGAGERYHDPLRQVYLKIRHEYPSVKKETALRLAVKALNDTMGPEGLVPSLLVFGVLPRFPAVNTNLPDQVERMEALKEARAEAATITARLRVRKALLAKTPRNVDLVLHKGDMVRVYRETDRCYTGPYPVQRVDGTQVYLIVNDHEVQHNIDQVIPATDYENLVNGDYMMKSLFTATKQFQSRKPMRACPVANILINEILHPKDPRNQSKDAMKAKKEEIASLVKRGTWKIVVQEELPEDSNIISGRFVVTIKDVETDQPYFKARFVAQGHRDKEKSSLIHNSTTVRQSSIRILLSLAACFGFRIWSMDVNNAYLQAASKLMRDVYLKPGKEFELPSGHILKLLRPLYGLADSGDYWSETFAHHMKNDLKMNSTAEDISFFFYKASEKMKGLAGTYVDDTLFAGDDEFLVHTNKTSNKFDSKSRQFDHIRFAGVYIDHNKDGFLLHQSSYIDRIEELDLNANFEIIRSARAQLTWLVHTRPDICAAANILAQVTKDTFTQKHIKEFNKLVKYLKKTANIGLRVQKLDQGSLHLRVYADASFANNNDLTSQLGYIILLADKFGKCNILHYASYKSRRVTRSVLGAEIYAFADAFDYAYVIRHDLEEIMEQKVPLQMLTDSRSLFDVIVKNSTTSERRLMIDIKDVRESYEHQLISNVGFVRSEDNPADAFTKPKHCDALQRILRTGYIDLHVEEWVARNNNRKDYSTSFEEKKREC